MFVCVLSCCLSPVVEIRDVKMCVLSCCLSPVVEIRDVKLCVCLLSQPSSRDQGC